MTAESAKWGEWKKGTINPPTPPPRGHRTLAPFLAEGTVILKSRLESQGCFSGVLDLPLPPVYFDRFVSVLATAG